ncbi:MAG: phosphate acyltransferase PlsX [Halanaerobiaceae bacterium]|nr:phosphate acyltransferase PlsX [Halanaerobiaceae bacterium]
MKIALDAMGGDHAPFEIIKAAVEALDLFDDIEIVLVGREADIKRELGDNYNKGRIEIINADEVIAMDESPITAIRKKKDSSIVKGMDLLKEKEIDAFISAGNTGAVMSAALFGPGRIKGIKRPSIIINFPNITGQTLVLDNGANTDTKPEHLLQFAIMGQIYAEKVLGIKNPRVGLLSIGEEKEKGNQLVKDTFPLLEEDPRIKNFIGNVEGRDIFNGRCDIVVCDGFVGNIVLKTTEGVASFMFKMLKDAFTKSLRAKIGALLLKPYLKALLEKTDYHQYGGAPLLGINGVVMISHGSSDRIAIANAVKAARDTVLLDLVNYIENEINREGE